jgi:hypothetical protein
MHTITAPGGKLHIKHQLRTSSRVAAALYAARSNPAAAEYIHMLPCKQAGTTAECNTACTTLKPEESRVSLLFVCVYVQRAYQFMHAKRLKLLLNGLIRAGTFMQFLP